MDGAVNKVLKKKKKKLAFGSFIPVGKKQIFLKWSKCI